MNRTIEQRLSLLEKRVGIKEAKGGIIKFSGWELRALNPGAADRSPFVTDDREKFPEGYGAFLGFVELDNSTIKDLESKFKGAEVEETAVSITYNSSDNEEEPYVLQIITEFKFFNKNDTELSHIGLQWAFQFFEDFESVVQFLKNKVKNPFKPFETYEMVF